MALVSASERASAQGGAAFCPFPYRAYVLRVAVNYPVVHGMRACVRASMRA